MQKYAVLYLLFGVAGGLLRGADVKLPVPLAVVGAPNCPQRPGVRAVRSESVQFGALTASLSSQANRDHGRCVVSAALWVTQNDISQQFDLENAGRSIFSLVDVAPDSSSILISAIELENERAPRVAVVLLREGTVKWVKLAEALRAGSCPISLEPEGFVDSGHVAIASSPLATVKPPAGCTSRPAFYSFDLKTGTIKPQYVLDVKRIARVVSGPVMSCRNDPDLIGACYTVRARVAYDTKGPGLVVWTLGSTHFLDVEDGMIPEELNNAVSRETRVYATMVICPLLKEPRSIRNTICIDKARDLKLEPAVKGVVATIR